MKCAGAAMPGRDAKAEATRVSRGTTVHPHRLKVRWHRAGDANNLFLKKIKPVRTPGSANWHRFLAFMANHPPLRQPHFLMTAHSTGRTPPHKSEPRASNRYYPTAFMFHPPPPPRPPRGSWAGGKGNTKRDDRARQTALAENGAERRRKQRKGRKGRIVVVVRSPCQENYPADAHTQRAQVSAGVGKLRMDSEFASGCTWSNGTGNSPSPGQPNLE